MIVVNPFGSSVPFRCQEATLDALQPPYSEQIPKAIRGQGSALLYGPTGLGKTFAMVAALRNFASCLPPNKFGPNVLLDDERTTGCAFVDWPEFITRAFRDHDCEHRVLSWRGPMFVDDVGQEQFVHSGYRQGEGEAIFSRFVNRRTGMPLPLWITSNLSPGEIGDRYGERTISRLAEHCAFIKFEGPDRRLAS
jgi:DNA replication protein DnaC